MASRWERIDAQARRNIAERRRRAVESTEKVVDPRSILSTRQLDAWGCTDRLIKLLCGRQAGKTYWACVWLLYGGLSTPGSLSVYLALTRSSARNIAWDEIVRVGTEVFGLPRRCFSEHTLTVKLPNGARILVVGTDDKRTIETWRGTKLYRAVIDEMGSQMPDLIGYFVEDIIWPALVKMNGRLALLGTPGLVCDGYWWDLTKPDVLARDPAAFKWDIYENPAIPHAPAYIDETLERFNWTRDTLKFRREWLAEWVQDKGALVYPYDQERNGLVALPTSSDKGIAIPPSSWRYEIGHDVGVVDPCAWVTWAWNPAWRGAIAVHAEIDHYDPDPAAERSRELLHEYRSKGTHAELVLDTGGMGKAHERIYRAKYGIPIIPAEKQGKASAIAELRGDLLSGAAQVLEGAALDPLRSQWAVLGWDRKKLVHSENQPDHIADAGLYGYRRVRHYTHDPKAHHRPPPLRSPERFVHDEEEMMKRRAQQIQDRERHTGRGSTRGLDR